jgi:Histidine kinase-, DNA gyrase B-, and HSP90-like ATPase
MNPENDNTTTSRIVSMRMAPQLLTRRLGAELYTPTQALEQLVANALDAGCQAVSITIHQTALTGVDQVTLTDDGCGIAPDEMDAAFGTVGEHRVPKRRDRDPIGSKGIGRFAAYALAYASEWTTVADDEAGHRWRQSWRFEENPSSFQVSKSRAPNETTGTSLVLHLRDHDGVRRLFSGVRNVHRVLFNAFAGYLLRYPSVEVRVNDELLDRSSFVTSEVVEEIPEGPGPAATLRHIVLGTQVDQHDANTIVFAAAGNTIKRRAIVEPAVEGQKYLAVVDSPYLQDLTNTAKSDLPDFDAGFLNLEREATARAKAYVARLRGDQEHAFLIKARANPAYPFKQPPQNVIGEASRVVYDRLIVELDREFGIGAVTPKQLQLILGLTSQLLRSEDLADVITNVLGLTSEEVRRFADILRRTTLSSVLALSELVVDRLGFLREIEELIYGSPAEHVLERRHLQKVIEAHTWIFGEQYHLMGADNRVSTVLSRFGHSENFTDPESAVQVDELLRDVPDFYLAQLQWNEGGKYTDHLVVEIKRPTVKVTTRHIDQQLERYTSEIVKNPVFGQRNGSHRFRFVIVSAEVADSVRELRYLKGEEPGLVSRPDLPHPTELWALRWSDLIDRRREELAFVQKQVTLSGDVEDLEYLRRAVGEYLPDAIAPP